MDHSDTADLADTFRARGAAIADACTSCGDCFRACPMTGPAGIGDADPAATAGAIVDLITGGEGNEAAIRWGEACSGSGYCIPACKHGINPRFMVQLARGLPASMPATGRCRRAGAGVPDDEPRRARVVAAADPARDAGALRAVARDAHQPARRGLLYRLQRPEDAAHRAAVPRHSRPARGRLRGHGRGRAMLRRVPVPRPAISSRTTRSPTRRSTGWPRPAPRPCCPGARPARSRSARCRCRITSCSSATSRST